MQLCDVFAQCNYVIYLRMSKKAHRYYVEGWAQHTGAQLLLVHLKLFNV